MRLTTDRKGPWCSWHHAVISALSLLVVSLAFPRASLAADQDPRLPDSSLEKAVLSEDWERVAEQLSSVGPSHPSPVLRLIKGHAALALNRNNESRCLFLSVSSEDDRKDWGVWTVSFLETNTKSPTANYFRGDALARLHEWDRAAAAFGKSVGLKQRNALALNGRGVVNAQRGDLSKAVDDFLLATMVDPELADAFANLGAVAIHQKEGAKGALRDYSEAIRLSPGFGLALYGRGCVKLVLHDWEAAKTDIKDSMARVGCAPQIIVEALESADKLLAGSEKTMLAKADGAKPGFSVSTTTLDKFERGDVGFSGWALQNSLKHAQTQMEVSAIIGAAKKGVEFKNDPAYTAAINRDIAAGKNWHTERGAIGNVIDSFQFNSKATGIAPGALAGEIGGSFGRNISRDYGLRSQHHNGIADSIANKAFGAHNTGGFDAAPSDAILDDGDWPYIPLYGLAFQMPDKSNTGGVQANTPTSDSIRKK